MPTATATRSLAGLFRALVSEARRLIAAPPPATVLDGASHAIVQLLRASPFRLTTSGIVRALEGPGRSEPVLKRRLADLVKRGVLVNSKHVPRGYTLAPPKESSHEHDHDHQRSPSARP